MKDSRTPNLRQNKTSEKETEESSAKAGHSHDQVATRPKAPSKPGLPLEKRMRQEKRRWHFLSNEQNRLTFAVSELEAKLRRLQESLEENNLESTGPNNEVTNKQSIRKLENNKDKIKMKIIEASEIQVAYEHIREHLQQEVRGMFLALETKQKGVAAGQKQLDRAINQFQLAEADTTLDNMVQMEVGKVNLKKEMDSELYKLRSEDKELKRQMELLAPLCTAGQGRQRPEEEEEEEEQEEDKDKDKEKDKDTLSLSFSDYQCFDACGASPSDLELVQDMEALKGALGYTEVQELVDKVVSQRAVKEQLLTEISQYDDTIKREAEVLAELEVQYAKLHFTAKPALTRVEMQAEVKQKADCAQQLQAELKQCQDLLDTVERGVNNLYFTMSCVPMEEMPSKPSADCSERLGEVRARLPTLLQRASEPKPEISDSDQKKAL